MSASAKKKLRKEENAAQLTEKQLKEQKEAKKLKIYTTIFVAAIAVILVVALIIAGTTFYKNSGIKEKNTVAAVVDGHEINSVDMSYYYADTINNNYSRWNEAYGENTAMFMSLMGLDLTKPLSEQQYTEDTTWADYFVETAISSAKSDHILYEKAMAEGFTLTDASRQMLDSTYSNLSLYASLAGYSDVDSYMRAIYGPGSSEESYRAYTEKSALASDYYNAYSENLVFDDAAIRAHEAENFDAFSSFSFASYNISYNYYLTGGTKDENGTITYSEEENEAARQAAKADAEALPQCSSVEELNAAIAKLNVNETAPAEASVFDNYRYSYCSTNIRDWLADSSRKTGDFTVVANETTSTDENGQEVTTVNSYSAYVFTGRNDNIEPMANVRHILASFEGGTTDDTGAVTYSNEEKAAAKKAAEDILAQYEAGEKTEDAFAQLAVSNSDDTGSVANGGLIENIAKSEGLYVAPFTAWAVDPARQPGETGIIETDYGYHVMYYVGTDALTYRDSMIYNELHSTTLSQWYEALLADVECVEKDTSLLNRDLVLAQQ